MSLLFVNAIFELFNDFFPESDYVRSLFEFPFYFFDIVLNLSLCLGTSLWYNQRRKLHKGVVDLWTSSRVMLIIYLVSFTFCDISCYFSVNIAMDLWKAWESARSMVGYVLMWGGQFRSNQIRSSIIQCRCNNFRSTMMLWFGDVYSEWQLCESYFIERHLFHLKRPRHWHCMTLYWGQSIELGYKLVVDCVIGNLTNLAKFCTILGKCKTRLDLFQTMLFTPLQWHQGFMLILKFWVKSNVY